MVRTLVPEQMTARQISAIKPSQYKCYSFTAAAGSDYADNEKDIGADLKAKYGTAWRVPAVSGFIMVSADILMKLNATGEDAITFDVSEMGHVWSFNYGDLLLDKIFFKNDSLAGIDVQVFVAGSEFIHLAESP